jgi:cholesterol transport system auxiliary component
MADTKISLTGRGAWRLLGASSLVLALAACSGLPTAPTQPVRYDLGMTDLAVPAANAAAPPWRRCRWCWPKSRLRACPRA